MNQPQNNHPCPYKGLQPFTTEDRDYFFGREDEIEIATSNLRVAPLTVLYGASGVGKTSVLMAGVVSRLQSEKEAAAIFFRDWQNAEFVSALRKETLDAIRKVTGNEIEIPEKDSFVDFLTECTKAFPGPLLFILDQFEEYFLYHGPTNNQTRSGQTKLDFDVELARAINRRDLRANFLLSLREDGLSKLDRLQTRIPNLLGNLVRLDHLNADSARAAIRKPLVVYNKISGEAPVKIEKELVEKLLSQVQTGHVMLSDAAAGDAQSPHDTGRIETSFLQLVLERLWLTEAARWRTEPEAEAHWLRAKTLDDLKGAAHIVRTHLDDVMASLEDLAREQHVSLSAQEAFPLIAEIFRFLVTSSGTKIAHTSDDLASFAELEDSKRNLLNDVLNLLALPKVRILRKVDPPPGSSGERFEIYHDVLGPAIRDWRGRYMKQQADIEAKAEAEAKLAEERAEAKRLAAHQQLQLDAANAQAEADRRHARVLRITLVAIVLLALGMGGVAVYAYRQKKVADEQKTEAVKQKTEAVRQKTLADQQTLHAREQTKLAEGATKRATEATADAKIALALANQSEAKALAAKHALIETQKKITAALDRTRQALAAQERALAAEKLAIEAQAQERSRREEVEALNLTLQEQIARSRVADDQSQAAGNKPLNISEIASSTTGGPTPSTSRIDAANLKRIVPSLSAERSAELAPHLQRAMDEFEINTPLRQAAFITVVELETSALRNFEEPLNYSAARLTQVFPKYFRNIDPEPYARQPEKIANRIYANRGGNGPEESGDGWRYRTRLVLWGRNRYREFGQALKLDLENNPDEAAKPALAFRIAAAYWKSEGYNQIADKGNIELIITKFFGPSSGGTGKAGAEYFGRAKEILGAQ